MEKREKMMLICKNMPDDVYKILDSKSKKRNLTEYIVDIVQNQNRDQELIRLLMTKLDKIEMTLDQMKDNSVVVKADIDKYEETEIDEPTLSEGTIVEAEAFQGGMDEADREEIDF
ncbi:hypothetical protein [Bacillus thuringiensis]|uniref:hypothetical protein n=1 Tax=Bacillus thuringiensis TaxID=1428 RepID=UPI00119D17FF|nr:hypothetical protein [Bacillus thuringiensis]